MSLKSLLRLCGLNANHGKPAKPTGGKCIVCEKHTDELHHWHRRPMCKKCYSVACKNLHVKKPQPKVQGGICSVHKGHTDKLYYWNHQPMCKNCYDRFCKRVRVAKPSK